MKKTLFRSGILLLSAAAAEIVAVAVPDSSKHQAAKHPYFAWLIIAVTAVYFIAALATISEREKSPTRICFFTERLSSQEFSLC